MRSATTKACGLILLLALSSVTVGCDSETAKIGGGDTAVGDVVATDGSGDAAGPDAPGDAAVADVPPVACPPQVENLANEPCAADAEGTSCRSTFVWCGRDAISSGCDCTGGFWRCWSAGAPAPCHTCCVEDHGEDWYCTSSGDCVQADGCLAEECCVPGASGDAWCHATFGDCSACEPGATTGTCFPQTCD